MFYRYILIGILIGFLASRSGSAEEPTYDVRGPALKPGFSFRASSEGTAKGMQVSYRSEGMLLHEMKIDVEPKREVEVTIEAADDRKITKLRSRVINDERTFTTMRGDEEHIDLKVDALVGRIVVSEQGKTGWTHRLAEGKPTEAEAESLKDHPSPHGEDYMPKERVKIGATWKVPPELVARLYAGENDLKAKGDVTSKLVEVRPHEGEMCAVIRTDGSVRGTFKREGKEASFELDYEDTEFRSLRHHVALKSESQCLATITSPVSAGGATMDQTIQGTMKSVHLVKVLK